MKLAHTPLDSILGSFSRKALKAVASIDLCPDFIIKLLLWCIMATYIQAVLINAALSYECILRSVSRIPTRGEVDQMSKHCHRVSTARQQRTNNLIAGSFDSLWNAICQVDKLVEQGHVSCCACEYSDLRVDVDCGGQHQLRAQIV